MGAGCGQGRSPRSDIQTDPEERIRQQEGWQEEYSKEQLSTK